jgi:hypothetical protein
MGVKSLSGAGEGNSNAVNNMGPKNKGEKP